jgi:hypothetical protein
MQVASDPHEVAEPIMTRNMERVNEKRFVSTVDDRLKRASALKFTTEQIVSLINIVLVLAPGLCG